MRTLAPLPTAWGLGRLSLAMNLRDVLASGEVVGPKTSSVRPVANGRRDISAQPERRQGFRQ